MHQIEPRYEGLGMTFDYNKTNTKGYNLYIQKEITNYTKILTKETALELITALYFSMVYYGSAIWMTPDLKSKNCSLLETAHYKVMGIASPIDLPKQPYNYDASPLKIHTTNNFQVRGKFMNKDL